MNNEDKDPVTTEPQGKKRSTKEQRHFLLTQRLAPLRHGSRC